MRSDLTQVNRGRLVNLANPDQNITQLKGVDNKLHSAISNLGTALQQVINNNFPASPVTPFVSTIILPGVQVVANDVLDNPHRVILPIDPTGNWTCKSITLSGCLLTLKIPSASGPFVMDVKIKQNHLTTDYKTLFQVDSSPRIPEGKEDAHNVKFAIDTLYNYDKFRVDILTADGTAAGVDCLLFGYYNWSHT